MKTKFVFALLILLLFPNFSSYAQVVAVSCIENEHSEKLPSDVTLYFENELLGALFDEGLIVTSLQYRKTSEQDFYKGAKGSVLPVSTNEKQEALDGVISEFESEPDFVVLIYFVYDANKKYDEFKRKNLLPCTQIACRVLDFKKSVELQRCSFLFGDMEGKVMFKKVDFCFLKIKDLILNTVRRKV